MTNVSKLVVIVNFLFAFMFLGAALMARSSQVNLDKKLTEAKATANKLQQRKTELTEIREAAKPGEENGKKFWERENGMAEVGLKNAEKKNREEADALNQQIANQRKEFEKIEALNSESGKSELAKKVAALKETREKVEAFQVKREKAKKSNEEAVAEKSRLLNSVLQQQLTLDDVEKRNNEIKKQLAALQKLESKK